MSKLEDNIAAYAKVFAPKEAVPKPFVPNPHATKEVVVKRYMLQITIYPDGSEYVNAWPLDRIIKEKQPKKNIVKATPVKVDEEEVY